MLNDVKSHFLVLESACLIVFFLYFDLQNLLKPLKSRLVFVGSIHPERALTIPSS